MNRSSDTIAAIATPPGRGGVGIIRISGTLCDQISEKILGKLPKPRTATFVSFLDKDRNSIDKGIALFFSSPHSYTGEDVLELQGHGGPVVMDLLLQRVLELGARLANPGEFTERAFLNDKMDLSQAEAVADLIDASSQQAARSAVRSLQGEFSNRINTLIEELIQFRMMIEAAIDFPEEEIDFLAEMQVTEQVTCLIAKIKKLLSTAQQGAILQQGITVVIVGKPNAGKSSLLNCLSQRDAAIVTDVAGTTRDPLREHIHIDGMPLHVIDTAGLREDSRDIVEAEGIRRSWQAIEQADLVLLVVDAAQEKFAHDLKLLKNLPEKLPVVVIQNKIDLIDQAIPQQTTLNNYDSIQLSAKNKIGIDHLRTYLKNFMGFTSTSENTFIARRRHLRAIEKAQYHLENGLQQIQQRAGELLAEDLRQAQIALAEITGEFTADDLLGRIFSSFCIGK